ncbi:uncharacterized protein A4U43_C09F3200 [Asparagus officinalis]|uniref:Uncharacterized protein n=1 Tax=Asparagus officinalis TaxID=4686 RepID=A0A5P1E4Z5_ASPOF|nr:uncharacterized protein A4U43_C09F3200 [Asparagus officinalis]
MAAPNETVAFCLVERSRALTRAAEHNVRYGDSLFAFTADDGIECKSLRRENSVGVGPVTVRILILTGRATAAAPRGEIGADISVARDGAVRRRALGIEAVDAGLALSPDEVAACIEDGEVLGWRSAEFEAHQVFENFGVGSDLRHDRGTIIGRRCTEMVRTGDGRPAAARSVETERDALWKGESGESSVHETDAEASAAVNGQNEEKINEENC